MMISGSRPLIRLLTLILMLAVVLLFTTPGLARKLQPNPIPCIIYVNGSVLGGNGSGSSWGNANPDLSDAIYYAVANCEIWVAKGTYKPAGTTRLGSFFLRNNVAVYGGFIGTETNRVDRNWQVNVTTLTGEMDTPAVDSDNRYNVVWVYYNDNTAILDGFTITAGYANDSAGNHVYGGGMEIINSSATLSNLIISENSAYYGGGIDFTFSNPVLTNVTVTNNLAFTEGLPVKGYGGGVYVRDLSHPILNQVRFYNNVATMDGGGLYNDQTSGGLTLTDVVFNGNHAVHAGGGMYNYKISADLTRVRFTFNHAEFGAGMIIDSDPSSVLVAVEFSGNEASSKGGGLYNYASNPKLTNVFFAQNKADLFGGGIGNYKSSPTLTNVSFTLNTAPNGAGIYNPENSHPLIRNSILWGDVTGEIYHDTTFLTPSTTTTSYSLVQGCNPGGTWNTLVCGYGDHNLADADPRFTNPGSYNLHLGIASPAINRGSNTFVIGVATDMDYKPRIQNGVVDLGPYELLFYPIYLPMIKR